jgi:hypothetical protein
MDDDPDYVVQWNQMLYRAGRCAGLSSFQGGTVLGQAHNDARLAAERKAGRGSAPLLPRSPRLLRGPAIRQKVPTVRIPAHEAPPDPCPRCGTDTPPLWDPVGGGHHFCPECLEQDWARGGR